MAKDATTPKGTQDVPTVRKEAKMLFNELIDANNLEVTVSPNIKVKLVSDGSMIIDAPIVDVRYKDAR